MKVLLISFSHHATLQNYMYLLKKNLLRLNCDVSTLGNLNVTSLYETYDHSYYIDCIDSASPSFLNIKLYLKNKKKLLNIINEISPDVIIFISKHIWNFFLLNHLGKYKVFHVFHDPIGHIGTSVANGVIIYNKLLSKKLNGIIVHSKISYENTLKYINPKCNVKLVPLGEKHWIRYNIPESFKNKLLIFGRISAYKGCEFIPEIAEKLYEQFPKCKIIVAGKCLDDVEKSTIDRIKKCKNIEFVNEFIPEQKLDYYFNLCDASIILHKSISQSGVIIDAYRHGHPIFCFNIEGMTEFIENKRTALLSEPFDLDNMVSNISELYSDFASYKEMSSNAYEFGKQKFSDIKMAEEIFRFIHL